MNKLDIQCWECGFTPKCCACKYTKKEVDIVKGKEQDVYKCYRKRKPKEQNLEYKATGKVTVNWNGTCFGFEWKYKENNK